jgi:hypothetical protein
MSFGACFAPVRRAESGVHASANTSPIAGRAPLGPVTCSSSLTTKDVQFTISLLTSEQLFPPFVSISQSADQQLYHQLVRISAIRGP